MNETLSSDSILFYLNSGRDISPLLTKEIEPKKSSMDCKALLVSAFSPQITISCTQAVDKIAENFGFHSFFQMLKPFGDKIVHNFQIKDSQLASRTAESFSLRFTRPLHELLTIQEAEINNSQRRHNSQDKITKSTPQLFSYQSLELLMSEYIQSINPKLQEASVENNSALLKLLKDSIYIKFFTKLLSSSYLTPFESMNHPIASFLIIKASESYDDARDQLLQFKQTQLPEYLNIDDILPIIVVIYDENIEEEQIKVVQLKEQIKRQLNVDAFPLAINTEKIEGSETRQLNPPVLISLDEELQNTHLPSSSTQGLSTKNIASIYRLLQLIIQKKLIPFMEKKIAFWDEQIITPRKSLTGRFFNVSKRYFSTNSAKSSNENSSSFDAEKGFYKKLSNESLIRKLADWSFMLRDYRYAYTTYEMLNKDFLSDKAWPHLASSQEMTAISLLMGASNITSKLKNDTIDPLLDYSNYTYFARCGLKTYALRSILIVSELFCTLRDDWTSAPAAIRWVKKALDDKLVGRIGRSLLVERIGYIYSIYVSNQAKMIMSKKLIKNLPENFNSETLPEETYINPIKVHVNNTATIGFTRERKSALWKLLAAKDWDPIAHPIQVELCLNSTKDIYENLSFSKRENSLYRKLKVTSSGKLTSSG
ncbi:hypothetical protein WICMUC_005762 [Wickerhamomyces mucosus]|uniref:Trafficking protein particle complex III-specific subunit 85 n=1 Tax=Wickerhamomyces mucosus TaxID=1378264 RepID=A0A9P8P3W4_9ASCO|nr:hypothetical protein WICMUC_005762 [Wickerhamomyces mucosus]